MDTQTMRLVQALEMYSAELLAMDGVELWDQGARLVLEARRRHLEQRIQVLRLCLENPSRVRHEC